MLYPHDPTEGAHLMSRLRAITFNLTVAGVVALTIFLWLDVCGTVNVHIDLVLACAIFAATNAVGYVVALCRDQIIDLCREGHDAVEAKVDAALSSHADIRALLGQFAEAVVEYGDQRATAESIQALRAAADRPPLNGHDPLPRLRSVNE